MTVGVVAECNVRLKLETERRGNMFTRIQNGMGRLSPLTFNAVLGALAVGGVAFGFYAMDAIGFWWSPDRRVTFIVVNGEVDENSVRVNRWWSIPQGPLTKEQKELQRIWFVPPPGASEFKAGEVFSFPHDEPDPTTCVYKVQGGGSESYTFPPDETKSGKAVPPCPAYTDIKMD